MSGARVALATCAVLPAGDEDAGLLLAAAARAGVVASWQVWDDPAVDWAGFDVVAVRSTWDYTTRRTDFLAWAASLPRVVNPAGVLAWSSDKVYLRDLDEAGVPVVPTTFVPPGLDLDGALRHPGDVVVKPSVGAGSRGAGRFRLPFDDDRALAHGAALHDAGRTVLVQPYLDGIDTAGETAVVCLGGEVSHAARKAPLLAPGARYELDRVLTSGGHELYVQETMAAATATADQTAVAERALAHLADRFGTVPAYARVDLLPGPDGPVVVELEVVEPSLFLAYAPDPEAAADRWLAAVLR